MMWYKLLKSEWATKQKEFATHDGAENEWWESVKDDVFVIIDKHRKVYHALNWMHLYKICAHRENSLQKERCRPAGYRKRNQLLNIPVQPLKHPAGLSQVSPAT